MPNESDLTPEQLPLAVRWTAGSQVPQIHVSEASLSYIGDQVYLTLGEVQGPSVVLNGPAIQEVVVRESVRLVFTEASFLKIVALVNRVAPGVQASKDKNR